MKTIKFKSLAKSMSLVDIAKILFLNHHSKDKKILDPMDREAILDSCERRGKLYALNKIILFHNIAIALTSDIEKAVLRLQKIQLEISTMILLSIITDLNDLNSKQVDIVFTDDNLELPSVLIQNCYFQIIQAAKKIALLLYIKDYLIQRAGFDIRIERDKKTHICAEEVLNDLLVHKDMLNILPHFVKAVQSGEVSREQFEVKEVYIYLKNPQQAILPSDKEKEDARDEIQEVILQTRIPS